MLANQERASRDLEDKLMKVLQFNQGLQTQLERLETHVKMLENQIAQQAESSTRAQGKLPARPEHDKKEYCNAIYIEGSFEDELLEMEELDEKALSKVPHEEHCEAVTLRSGKILEVTRKKKTTMLPQKPTGQARAEEEEIEDVVTIPSTDKAKEIKKGKEELKPYSPPIPFPQRLAKPTKLDKELGPS
ncbi:unnamed protein product [Rhodiola kirilowii]